MKHSLVKQNIIETAAHLFYQKGYNLTGINEIIREAGIAKATLYNHFKSKDAICLAYLEYKNDAFIKGIAAFVKKKPQGEEQCIAIFDFLRLFFDDSNFNGCWCINTISEIPRENESIRKKIQAQKKDFMTFIQNVVARNLPSKTTKEQVLLTRHIYLLYEGAISESHLHQDSWPIDSAREFCKQILT
ncbi:MAG: TetR/AcrR family transcriptional regulator [Aureispira sp.]|nr:TetR/AcrR family transcriptional regulator [Aureispira sp.]